MTGLYERQVAATLIRDRVRIAIAAVAHVILTLAIGAYGALLAAQRPSSEGYAVVEGLADLGAWGAVMLTLAALALVGFVASHYATWGHCVSGVAYTLLSVVLIAWWSGLRAGLSMSNPAITSLGTIEYLAAAVGCLLLGVGSCLVSWSYFIERTAEESA